jgi:UDP-N-acetylglucosamine 1-carboxyvinyltransferase
MSRFVIQGGRRIAGEYTPAGNKNAVLPMLAACVLTDEPVVLHNVPLIEDVRTMLEILDSLGVSVRLADHTVTLCAAGLRKSRLDPGLCGKVRGSILFAGPLGARIGRATLFPPGGDVIGRRRLDTHFDGLRALGIEVRGGGAHFTLRRRVLAGAEILLDEASVTATENILMAAALASGRTTIFNAACEPHVQDLCALLGKMGAAIEGIGTNRLQVEGAGALRGATHTVQPDYVEAGSFMMAAAVTGGELIARGLHPAHLLAVERVFARIGVRWTVEEERLCVRPRKSLRILRDLGGAIPKVEDGPWPSFPSDLMSAAIVAATQAAGTILFFEKMFESRMYFVDRLIEMGARIIQCDPHRIVVIGPSRLHGVNLASPDIRAGMALLLAALCARGTSVIQNAQSIDRGYERVDEKLRGLGAEISREE